MIFRNRTHNNEFVLLVKRMNAEYDVYKLALAYLFTADTVCLEHIEDLYDFEDDCIDLTALNKSWQTSTSLKTTRLAFNLYTGSTVWCSEDEVKYLNVADIFCCELAPYYLEAVKIRYPEYTK